MVMAAGTLEAQLKPHMCNSLKERYGKLVKYVALNVYLDKRLSIAFVVSELTYLLKSVIVCSVLIKFPTFQICVCSCWFGLSL